jgi:type VI secretion system protein ImpK
MSDRDPFNTPDGTRLRPRPGAGRRGWGEAPRPAAPAFGDAVEPIADASRELLGVGLNPLVRAASPLLLLAGQLRGSVTPMDVDGLRQLAMEEIRRFEENARGAGVQSEVIVAARYVLCAGLDEAVLSTPWGAQSNWSQHPLLVALHREAWGGEKFFEMLDRISQDPDKYIDLMELQYLCLAFGFGGKYQVQDRGYERLAAIQQDLYRSIRSRRHAPPNDLSIHWRGLEDRRNPLIRYVPWWVVGAMALAVLAIAFTFYYTQLANVAAPVHAELSKVGIEAFTLPVSAPVRGPSLKKLLAPEEAKGTMRVDEQGGRTQITLLARDLFASGSATVNPSQYETLQALAVAINQVPGRVLVEGHTDDQPIRLLKYRDNFELSRERALGVVKALRLGLENHARVSWTGVGSTKPLYTPASDPANRARNRRVEIIHIGGI